MEIKKTERVRDNGKSNEGWKKRVKTMYESTMLRDGIKKAWLGDKKLLFRSLLYANNDPLKLQLLWSCDRHDKMGKKKQRERTQQIICDFETLLDYHKNLSALLFCIVPCVFSK